MVVPTDRSVKGPIVHNEDDITFEADEALSKFALVYVSAAGKVSETSANTSAAIGIADRDYADLDKDVSVLLLARGRVLHMIASAAVSVGVYVMPAAAGKVATWAHTTNTDNAADASKIGVALTAASADGDVIEVLCI